MRYSLLNFVSRPSSNNELVCVTVKEAEAPMEQYRFQPCSRVSRPGAIVGPLPPQISSAHPTADILASLAAPPAEPDRNLQVEVETGLLICPETGRWYPVRGFIPEILPDHLRDFQQDFEFLRTLQNHLPLELFRALDQESLFSNRLATDQGIAYKRSEIGITARIDDQKSFFAPGYMVPFIPTNTFQTVYVVRVFSFCLSLLQNAGGQIVLDTGCGYAWSTEWLMKSGFEPIGVDITRAYLDVSRQRTGAIAPHLVRGDTENLPIRNRSIDAVIGYDSFHHIPDRPAAMRQFDRVLGDGGHIILAEPNEAHEAHEVSQSVMEKYGILERGMELQDVLQYVAGTGLCRVDQVFPVQINHRDRWKSLSNEFVAKHNWSAANLFVINRAPVPPKSLFAKVSTVARRFLCGDLI
ncbi:MAG TPA: methyltransferase domain-containing protein [Paludibaculum sp.]